ncbi:MAG: LytR/AlgR family response regulator transcription factor [Lachnospiraceae bacterium]
MKIAVCDDEERFVDNTCTLLDRWAKQRNICLSLYRFSDGDALLQAHRSEAMDLIFLDVLMPLLNGIDAAKELRTEDPAVPIIFLSSAREYAVDSYEVKAFQYLVKPLDEKRLWAVLDDFSRSICTQREMLVLHTQVGFCRISVEDVDYLEAQNKHVLAYLSNGTSILLSENFSRCEQLFTLEKGFCKSHRSYLVNLSHVKEFTKTQISMNTGAAVPISRNCYQVFKETYFSYMFR